MPNSEKFASPIGWLDQADMQVVMGDENRIQITALNNKQLQAKAFYDGMLVWRSESAGSAKGNLELVLRPGLWPKSIQNRFGQKEWLELPPGRVVYRGVGWNVVKAGLEQLIKTSWDAYEANPSQYRKDNDVYDCLEFIPGLEPNKVKDFYFHLDRIKKTNPADLNKALRDEIGRALESWRAFDPTPATKGIPVRAGKTLFSLTHPTGASWTTELEIRNLYGEPLNPFYFLKRLSETGTPAWALNVGSPDLPRLKAADGKIYTRTPQYGGPHGKEGGIEYTLIDEHRDIWSEGEKTYKSRLVWWYEKSAATNIYEVKIKAREGAKVTPGNLKNLQTEVQRYWDFLRTEANKFCEIFQIPGELLMAIIQVEALKINGIPDLRSFRLEPVRDQTYAKDYEDLRKAIGGTPAVAYTEATLLSYWQVAGGAKAQTSGKFAPVEVVNKTTPIITIPSTTFDPSSGLAEKGVLKQITWQQLESMVAQSKQHLVSPIKVKLPTLGTYKKGKKTFYEFDLLANDSALNEPITAEYLSKVGGVGRDGKKRAATNLEIKPPFPYRPTEEIAELKPITWAQLNQILNVLRTNGKKKVPKLGYALSPLKSASADPKSTTKQRLITEHSLAEAQADDLTARYFNLQNKSIKYVDNAGNTGSPGFVSTKPPPNDHLTLNETRQVVKLYPGRMSFGFNQCLFATMSDLINFIHARYSPQFFSTHTNLPEPAAVSGNIDARIDWAFDHALQSKEIQVILLLSYLRKAMCDKETWRAVGPFNVSVKHKVGQETKTEKHTWKFRVGERMTLFDLPRVAGAYNHGSVAPPIPDKPAPTLRNEDSSDWGLFTAGNYIGSGVDGKGHHGLAALHAAFAILSKPENRALVRLQPDIAPDAGMEPR